MNDNTVQWPASIVNQTAEDLAAPIRQTLLTLNLIEADDRPFWRTPFDKQAITAGALATSKWTGTAIASVGGAGTVLATIAAFTADERIAYAFAAVILLVGVAIALAVLVRADVTARGVATAAMYQARAQVATSFLATAGAVVGQEPRYWARDSNQRWHPVSRFKEQGGGIVAEEPDGSVLPVADITDLEMSHVHSVH